MTDFSQSEALAAIRAVLEVAPPVREEPDAAPTRADSWARLVRLDPTAGGRQRLQALFDRLELPLTDPIDCRPHLRWPRPGRSTSTPLLVVSTLRLLVLLDDSDPVDGLLALRSLAGALDLEPLAFWLGQPAPEGWSGALDPTFLEELLDG